MSRIFCIIGKSASGKDTIFRRLVQDKQLGLKRIIPYTTRPMRSSERDGEEYFFVSRGRFEQMQREGLVIESRTYQTVHGPWTYFTADDGQITTDGQDAVLVGTLDVCRALRSYYGESAVVPLYIDVEDGLRLQRALDRERGLQEPDYREMCRRFLADCEDFSEEKLKEAGIDRRYDNTDLESCVEEICRTIRFMRGVQ